MNKITIAIVLSAIMLVSAGCAGLMDDNGDNDEPEMDDVDTDDTSTDDSQDASSTDDGDSTDSSQDDSQSDTEPSDDTNTGTDDSQAPTGNMDDSPEGDDGDTNTGTDESDGDNGVSDSDDETGDNGDNGDAGNGDEAPPEDEPPEEETYTLTVEVGHDAPVTLERLSDGETTTREASGGTVDFNVLEGDYVVNAEGHETMSPEDYVVQVDGDTTVGLQSYESDPIEVTVVDAETGDPVEGAEVSGVCNWWYSSGDDLMQAETDENGVATLGTLSPTTCDAGISADGYEEQGMFLSVPDDDGTTFELDADTS